MRFQLVMILLACALLGSCGSPTELVEEFLCATDNPGASINVAGTYDYRGTLPYNLNGSITFQQNGAAIECVETTYTGLSANRPLIGSGTLVGNTLQIALVPENGDMDYRADVTIRFSDGGDRFCVAFSDTNADAGGLGSFTGTRRP